MVTMFECALVLISQFISIIPMLIALWLIFDFIGALLFGK